MNRKSIANILDKTEEINDFIKDVISGYERHDWSKDSFTDGEIIFFRNKDKCEKVAEEINSSCGYPIAHMDYEAPSGDVLESAESGCYYIYFDDAAETLLR